MDPVRVRSSAEATPLGPRGVVIFGALMATSIALLVATSEPGTASTPVVSTMAALGAAFLYALHRSRIRCDSGGLERRRPFGTHRIRWEDVDDFYFDPPHVANVRAGSKRIRWPWGWPGGQDVLRVIEGRARHARVREFELLGARECDLPREFTVDTAPLAGGAVAIGLCLLCSAAVASIVMDRLDAPWPRDEFFSLRLIVLALLASVPCMALSVVSLRAGREVVVHARTAWRASSDGIESRKGAATTSLSWVDVTHVDDATDGGMSAGAVRLSSATSSLVIPASLAAGPLGALVRRKVRHARSGSRSRGSADA